MLTELATAVFIPGLPVLLLVEEIARLLPVRARVEWTLPRRTPARATTAARLPARVA